MILGNEINTSNFLIGYSKNNLYLLAVPYKEIFRYFFFNFFRMITFPLLILSPPSTDSKRYYNFWVSIIIENQSSDYHLIEFD